MPETHTSRPGRSASIYALDDDRLLLVASDRISTFDVVLPTEIPDKGRVLTGLSGFWFTLLAADRPEPHARDPRRRPLDGVPAPRDAADRVRRARLPRRLGLEGLPARRGEVCGHALPEGLRESDKLPEPIFTPATKATERATTRTSRASRRPSSSARSGSREVERVVASSSTRRPPSTRCARGIIIADTKFELGLDADGNLVLGDEALTPDSSRFWPGDTYEPGRAQDSFDKQFVRDYCETTGWDKTDPGPELPDDVVAGHAREVHRGVRAADDDPVPRLPRRARRWCSGEGDRPRPAEAGHPRPAGRGRRARRSGTSASRSRDARVGKVVDLEVDAADADGGRGAGREDVRAAAREPADRVVRGRDRMASPQPRIGVVTYPGSQDDRDALWALARARRGGGRPSGTRSAELPDLDAVVLPGGFSYGDYLRCGAIARFSPATAAVREFADARRPRARDLQRLPDPLRGRPPAGRPAAERVAPLRLPRRAARRRARRPAVHDALHRRAAARASR